MVALVVIQCSIVVIISRENEGRGESREWKETREQAHRVDATMRSHDTRHAIERERRWASVALYILSTLRRWCSSVLD